MKAILFLFINVISLHQLEAQSASSGCLSTNHYTYYNGFQHTRNDPQKLTLALAHAQNLAKACPASLRGLFHTFYAQEFSKRIRGSRANTTERTLLDMLLKDTSQVITGTLEPVILWVNIQESENQLTELTQLTHNFINTQLRKKDWYEDKVARYALLIYQIISTKQECVKLAQALLTETISGLKTQLSRYELQGDDVHNHKRAWYRYLYAYSNLLQGEEFKNDGNIAEAEKCFRTAAQFSPDLIDKANYQTYDYEIAFLIGEDKSDGFKEDYLAFLENYPNKEDRLHILTSLSITDPRYLVELHSFYSQHYSDKVSFEEYWQKQLNNNLIAAPPFSLSLLNTTNFSLEAHKGKWVLIDFWGTWCEPCLEEMPNMQRFYREVVLTYPTRISLLTIACKDTDSKVKTFINKYKYNFPVAMADTSIEGIYTVTAYPTKILITPQGKMIPIPTNENWVEKVKLYCQL